MLYIDHPQGTRPVDGRRSHLARDLSSMTAHYTLLLVGYAVPQMAINSLAIVRTCTAIRSVP